MLKVFTFLAGLVGNIDAHNNRVEAFYELWGTIYKFVKTMRGDVSAVPVPEALRASAPVVQAPAASTPPPAPLPDEAFDLSQPAA